MKFSDDGPGTLYLVATPIGNLEDMTYRAVRILGEVDAIAAEDTRHTRKLLDHYGIAAKQVFACHDHNERNSAGGIVDLLKQGKTVALCSDAGMPVINDPGFRVVEAVRAANLPVTVLPGASAVLSALVLSNFAPHEFVFLGFPPRKSGKRKTWLEAARRHKATLICMEAPHRLPELLADAAEVYGDISGAVCLEITKRFEDTVIAPLPDLATRFATPPKGEIMVVFDGSALPDVAPSETGQDKPRRRSAYREKRGLA